MPRLPDLAARAAPPVFVVLWASGFIGAKFGLPYAGPLTFLALRMAVVVALLGLIVLITRPPLPDGRTVRHNVVTGLLVHGLYLGGVFLSIDHRLPAGLSALVVGLQPVLTSTIANRVLGERVLPVQWAGLVLGLIGVYMVVHGRTAGDGATPFAWAAATVALFGITIGTLYQKRFGGAADWRYTFLVQYGAAGTLFGIGALLSQDRAAVWTGEFLFALGWLVFVLSFGAVWLLYFLIRKSAATRFASLFYLTPPVTALMAWLLFGERLEALALAGMAVCVAGVFLVNRAAAR